MIIEIQWFENPWFNVAAISGGVFVIAWIFNKFINTPYREDE